MSAVPCVPGVFIGWDQVINTPGQTMAWNWPRDLGPADAAFERCFPAEALGTINGDLVIRTPPEIPHAVVEPLAWVISVEQCAGQPVAISLMPGKAENGHDPSRLYATLYSPNAKRLNSYFKRMSKRMRKNRV